MFHIVLYEPEIPPNTGNIIRLCANTGAQLHLIKPLGFELNDKKLRRAGLDYHEFSSIYIHDSLENFRQGINADRMFAFTTKGAGNYSKASFRKGDVLLFGPETRGLPKKVLDELPESRRLYLPMKPGSRSLNLSNTVSVALYEAWRQTGFEK